MKEILAAGALLLLMALVAAAFSMPAFELLELGMQVMLTGGALGIPLQALYFAALRLALGARRPEGWYWRPFAHHHLLSPSQRWWVLPLFVAGGLAFLVAVIGIAIVVVGGLSLMRGPS